MIEKKISGAPVLNEKRELVGILSEKDCLKVIIESAYHDQPVQGGKVKDYMNSNNIKTISVEKDVLDVANEFLNTNYRRFPVLDKGKLVGQISRRDILKAAQNMGKSNW